MELVTQWNRSGPGTSPTPLHPTSALKVPVIRYPPRTSTLTPDPPQAQRETSEQSFCPRLQAWPSLDASTSTCSPPS